MNLRTRIVALKRFLPKRKSAWLVAALVIGGLVEMTYAVGLADHVFVDPTPPIVQTSTSNYGLSISLLDLSDPQLQSQLAGMKAIGAGRLRLDISWASVQAAGPNSYNWAIYDKETKVARDAGFNVLMIVDFTPSWAQGSSCNDSQMCPPADPNAYGKFAGAVANHFKSYGVTEYEIWNEPNISYRFHGGADPVLYTKMLQASYKAIKATEPISTVVAASTAPTGTDSGDYSPVDFLTAMYANGAHGYFDAISSHPYTYPLTPSQSGPSTAWGQLSIMHDVMTSNGDGDKKIWLTEFGAPTNGPTAGEHVTEAVQAQIMSEAVTILKTESWAGPLYWYEYADTSNSTSTSENFYGLVRSDGTPKPALDAYKQAALGN